MAQVRQVVSEALQATVRRLLPSQQGFTEDLQASNVITPIIDLTPTAEGEVLPVDLSRALAFGSQTAFYNTSGSTTLANSPGFYRVVAGSTVNNNGSAESGNYFNLVNGVTTKIIWRHQMITVSSNFISALQFDFIVFLAAGDSLTVTTNGGNARIGGSYRQIADVNGNVVQPSGFSSS